jgi:hypothetical protein
MLLYTNESLITSQCDGMKLDRHHALMASLMAARARNKGKLIPTSNSNEEEQRMAILSV